MTRELVYGRNPVREALRGRREVLEVWSSERASSASPWLAEGPRPRVVKERQLTEAAGTADHQGIVAWCEPYPYADGWELAARERPLLASGDLSASLFRYDSGVAGLRLRNAQGELVMLPFQGQQIWSGWAVLAYYPESPHCREKVEVTDLAGVPTRRLPPERH